LRDFFLGFGAVPGGALVRRKMGIEDLYVLLLSKRETARMVQEARNAVGEGEDLGGMMRK